MPFQTSPGRDDGYDVADYYNVDPRYGTLGDFVEFTHAARQRGMRVLIDLSVVPIGVGVSLSAYVAACERIIQEAGLTHTLHAFGTNVEGEWGEVMAAVKRCHEVMHAMGAPRVHTTMRVGTRVDRPQTLEDKVRSVERELGAGAGSAAWWPCSAWRATRCGARATAGSGRGSWPRPPARPSRTGPPQTRPAHPATRSRHTNSATLRRERIHDLHKPLKLLQHGLVQHVQLRSRHPDLPALEPPGLPQIRRADAELRLDAVESRLGGPALFNVRQAKERPRQDHEAAGDRHQHGLQVTGRAGRLHVSLAKPQELPA